MELASAIPSTEPVPNDLIDIALTSTTPLETEASSSQTESELPKSKRDSLKRFFGRKKNENESQVENSPAIDQNLLPTSSSVEALGGPKKLYTKMHTKLRKTSGESSATTVESEGRRSIKDTLSNYWNSIFNKKSNKNSVGSTGPQNSKSVETKGAMENADDKMF